MEPTKPALPGDALYLIDTMGYIFRAFFALPPLTNSQGTPTHAVLGFVNMLRKLLAEAHPRALAAVWDAPGPTFRDERFAHYKATRAPMPDTLRPQIPYIRRVLEAFCIPILEAPGFEADDVIGTIARKHGPKGGVVVVSSDKDLLQLVNGGVTVYNPSSNQLLDAAGVIAKLGVRPEQVADLLALRGDAVDNIPGAPGIGEKGAQQLIVRFGSVEQALEHAAEVERKTYRESLQNHREQILLSKELATIHTDVPLVLEPAAWERHEPDVVACRLLFRELEFHHLLQALAPEAPAPAALPCTRISGPEPLATLLAQNAALPLAVSAHSAAVTLATAEQAWQLEPAAAASLGPALRDPHRQWIWWDSKAIGEELAALDLPRPELRAQTITDLQLIAYLNDPTRSSYTESMLWPEEAAATEAGALAARLAQAAPAMRRQLASTDQESVYAELDLPLIPVLEAMEGHGVRLDPAPLAVLSQQLEQRCQACQEEVFRRSGLEFNLNSPQQLAEVLFEKLQFPAPARRGKAKARSTAADVLETLAEFEPAAPVIKPILEYRQLAKLKSTYVDALPPLIRAATGRVHTHFSITGSATGRLASSNPNLQNIPVRSEMGRQIRAAFIADPGNLLISADYSQIELRLLAHFSQDALLLEAYRSGEDIHTLTAAEVFGISPLLVTEEFRRRAKAVNFGIVYGLSAFGLARQLGIPQAEAARFIRRYFERYQGVKDYIERELDQARRAGFVRTLFGRVRPIPNLDARNPALRGFAERTAINSPLQGTAADLIKLAMIRLHPQLQPHGARLLLQVHDELVLEAPAGKTREVGDMVKAAMEQVAALSVPLRVEIGAGPNWRDLQPL